MSTLEGVGSTSENKNILKLAGAIGLTAGISLICALPSFADNLPDPSKAIQDKIDQNALQAELNRSEAALKITESDLLKARDALNLQPTVSATDLSRAQNALTDTNFNGSTSIQNQITSAVNTARSIPNGTGFVGATFNSGAVGAAYGQNFGNGNSVVVQGDTKSVSAAYTWGGPNALDTAKLELAKKITEDKVALEKAQREMLLKITNEVNVIMEAALNKINVIESANPQQFTPDIKSKLLNAHFISLTNSLAAKLRECSDVSGLQRCSYVFVAVASANENDIRVVRAIDKALQVSEIALGDIDGASTVFKSARDQIASFGSSPNTNIANNSPKSNIRTETAFNTTKPTNKPSVIPTKPGEVAKN